jgi:chromosome segregation ATPase
MENDYTSIPGINRRIQELKREVDCYKHLIIHVGQSEGFSLLIQELNEEINKLSRRIEEQEGRGEQI